MARKAKQQEQLPLDLGKPDPSWKISERSKRAGKHWFPIWRKQLNKGETNDDNRAGG